MLAGEVRRRHIEHLHNHFADASGTVTMLTATLAAVPFSFTMHGAEILREPGRWRLDRKVELATHVIAVSW